MIPVNITADTNHSEVERLQGFSVHESAGTPAAAEVVLRKASVSGAILFYIDLNANESASLVFPRGISTEGGTYVEVVSGTITGVLFHEV